MLTLSQGQGKQMLSTTYYSDLGSHLTNLNNLTTFEFTALMPCIRLQVTSLRVLGITDCHTTNQLNDISRIDRVCLGLVLVLVLALVLVLQQLVTLNKFSIHVGVHPPKHIMIAS